MKKDFAILGIESTCDETSAALLVDGKKLVSNVIYSQIEEHKKYHGVVPELASRAHAAKIAAVIDEALNGRDIDCVAFARGPGLPGGLMVGRVAAQTLANFKKVPILGINHLEGHLFACEFEDGEVKNPLSFPLVALVVSGGHTELWHVKNYGQYKVLGRTRDDAAGEAFEARYRIDQAGGTLTSGDTSGETSLRFDVTGEQSVTVTAVPDDGYFFVNWSDGVTSRTRTDSNFKQNLDVTAVFSRASVEIAGEGSGLLGMNYTFTARLSGQYAKAENLHWYVNGVESKEAAGRTSVSFIVDPLLANQTYTVYAAVTYNDSQVVSNTLTVSFESGIGTGSSSSSSSSSSSASGSSSSGPAVRAALPARVRPVRPARLLRAARWKTLRRKSPLPRARAVRARPAVPAVLPAQVRPAAGLPARAAAMLRPVRPATPAAARVRAAAPRRLKPAMPVSAAARLPPVRPVRLMLPVPAPMRAR